MESPLLQQTCPAEQLHLQQELARAAFELRQRLDDSLGSMEPLQLVLLSILVWTALQYLLEGVRKVAAEIQDNGFQGFAATLVFSVVRVFPGGAAYIQKEQDKVVTKLQASMKEKRMTWTTELPKAGLGDAVIERLREIHAGDEPWQGKCSGTVYMGGKDYDKTMNVGLTAFKMFAHTNPLHSDVFPSISKFEAEVVAMAASILGSKSVEAGGEVCGNMTSGGSESILMAVKATRDFMRATKNITEPEMIIAESAHSAYDKACQYFNIRLRRTPVGKDYRANVSAMKKLITRNTIMMVGSAPGFPHGVIDPIQELGVLALRKQICLHVDCCLGGFVLPFARKLGYPIPSFDFSVPGVTSISIDTHKYGQSIKGTSVVLYRDHAIRRHQFVAVTEWSGGLYISPSAAGSRPGGLIAAAWATLTALGEDGYLDVTRRLMEATTSIVKGVADIDGLYVLGKPDMTVVAIGCHDLDIYKVNDVMSSKGWHLSALQRPPSIHMCVTLQHVDVVDTFLEDLAEAVDKVRKHPEQFEDGMAPIYGAAAKMPHRGTIRDLLTAYMDSTC